MTSTTADAECPLCSHRGSFVRLRGPLGFGYSECSACRLIFMDRASLPSPEDEKRRYATHRNGPQHPGYVRFLEQAIAPALPYLDESMRGLDFGCGPVPTLSVLLARRGLRCEDYDPFFEPKVLPPGRFHFIFATEVFEHLFWPGRELRLIRDVLRPQGLLVVMTELWTPCREFSEWHYARDTTHVSFYDRRTIESICRLYSFRRLPSGNARVLLLQKA